MPTATPALRALAVVALAACGWSAAAQAPLAAPAAPAPAAASAPLPAAAPASAAAPAAAASGAANPVAGAVERAHARLRQAHLGHLYERLTVEPDELKRQCRFESDIATAPPAGLVALSFDDGPDPERTPQILAVLEHYKIQATFFLIGEKMKKYPELVAEIVAKGHLIGSHSWSHPNFHDIPEAAQRSDIEQGLAQMPADGVPVKVYRYPYGNSSCAGNALLHAQGWRIVGWHVDSCDWAYDRTGSVDAQEALSCGVTSQYRSDFVGHVAAAVRARKGGIVLMHEIHANTLAKLPEVIEEIRKDGYDFTRVDDPRLADSLR
ncbi:MAG: polysaccharide deacetylase family protein [Pelomonas sp.]|nr:polysaccharide deacetylase family protein [Roseateles sp.]